MWIYFLFAMIALVAVAVIPLCLWIVLQHLQAVQTIGGQLARLQELQLKHHREAECQQMEMNHEVLLQKDSETFNPVGD